MSEQPRRERLRQVAAGLGALALPGLGSGCRSERAVSGGFVGPDPARGHRLREASVTAAAASTRAPRSVKTLIIGAGIGGLSAAWWLEQQGQRDLALLELEPEAGGNSRGHQIRQLACPLGAHYLPVPLEDVAHDSAGVPPQEALRSLLAQMGLMQQQAGRWGLTAAGERHLCHAPQERLFYRNTWQEGLLPVLDLAPSTQREYERFAGLIRRYKASGLFRLPASSATPDAAQQALDGLRLDQWLAQNQFEDPQLRWYLDYCCRDDYGAGIDTVSAWAGVHYFASRHGFQAPGSPSAAAQATDSGSAVFTWPQGNGWLSSRMRQALGERVHLERLVTAVSRRDTGFRVWAQQGEQVETWDCGQLIVATPLFIAQRLLRDTLSGPQQAALQAMRQRLQHAAWAVLNLGLSAPLTDRGGAAPAWDNVLYGSAGLGYVDARHQEIGQGKGPALLTLYDALGIGPQARQGLLERPWAVWKERAIKEMATAHPDFADKLEHLDVARYGHAMAVPQPGWLSQPMQAARRRLLEGDPHLAFAHSDVAGYSVFEEAFAAGVAAAARLLKAG